MRVGTLFALFLLILSLSFASDVPQVSLPELGIGFIMVVALLSIVIVALSSMVGEALQSPGITAWSKEQLRETVAGIILVVLLWGLVTGTNSLVGFVFLQDDVDVENLPQLGASALDDHINRMELLYLKVADAYHTAGIYQGFSYFASMGGYWFYFGQGSSPYFGVGMLLGPLSVAANNLTIQILTFRLIKLFTLYVGQVFLAFILPISLALRVFPFTRRAGNTMIAISLGALLVFPISLMFVQEFGNAVDWNYSGALTKNFTYDKMELDTAAFSLAFGMAETLCGKIAFRVVASLGEWFWGLQFAAIAAATCGAGYAACFAEKLVLFVFQIWPMAMTFVQLAIGGLLLPAFHVETLKGSSADALALIPELLLPAVAEATGFSIVSLLIVAMITFTGTKAISTALGGEYILYGVSRFV